MKYFVFDIECCDSVNICEFGYVIANESFEILEKNVLLINPECPFNFSGRSARNDFKLYFSEEEYFRSPKFPSRYNTIKELIEAPDQIVIGHAICNDIGFLKTACKRYGLGPINFKFLDSQKVYGEFFNQSMGNSLANAEVSLNLNKPEYLHKSDDDAKLTLELIESVCKQLEVSITELMKLCPTACGNNHRFHYQYDGTTFKDMLNMIEKNPSILSSKKRLECFKRFTERMVKGDVESDHPLCDTVICFSKEYEKNCNKDTFVLLDKLGDAGCKYSNVISDCDYYVATEEELLCETPDIHTRYYAALYARNEVPVKIITMQEVLELLNVTKAELHSLPMPKVKNKATAKKKQPLNYTTGNSSSTVGDLLKAKGIDLLAMFNS